MTVLLRGSRYGTFAQRKSAETIVMSYPTNETNVLLQEMQRAFSALYDPQVPYKKAGVVLHTITSASVVTGSLFAGNFEQKQDRGIDALTDALNDRFGAETVCRASTRGMPLWIYTQAHISKKYTTIWRDIPSVKAS
jgi:DNA polymerase V